MKTYLSDALERVGLTIAEYGERITFYGFCGVHVEGHCGVMEYGEESITVRLKKRTLVLRGCSLKIKEITKDELFISGKITGMDINHAR